MVNQSSAQTNADINSINYPGVIQGFQNTSQDILNQRMDPNQLAGGITAAGAKSWTDPGTAQSYMNPYESTALASQVSLDRNNLLNPALSGIDSAAAGAGALGGDRSGVERANVTRDFNNTEANTIAQGMNSAYQTGQQAFQSDANRNLQGQTAGAQTKLAGANSNIYADYAQGQNAQNMIAASAAPGQQLANQAGILAGVPDQSTHTTTVQQNGSPFGQILGGILGGAGTLIGGLRKANGGIVDFPAEGTPEGQPKKKSKKKK